jgi:streptogramin lyase
MAPIYDSTVFSDSDRRSAIAWFVAYDRGGLAALDPTTLAVRKAFRVDDQDSQGTLAATKGTVWYPTFDNDSVLEVKP